MADLVRDIEAQIAGAKAAFTKQSVGTIREIGDGVARVEGLADVMLNEMIDLGHMYYVLKWLGPLGGWLFRRGMYKAYYRQ